MKKIVSLVLCAFLLLPLIGAPASALTPTQASDVDGDGVVTARDAAILARFVAGWDGYVDTDGGLSYPWKKVSSEVSGIQSFDPDHPFWFEDGYTFRVLCCGGSDNGTQIVNGEEKQKFTTTHFSVKDVCPWTKGSWSDNNNYAQYYTKISEVVAERNAYLKSTYNVTVEEERVTSAFDALKLDTFCGLRSYDAVMLPVSSLASQATVGLLKNVYSIPTVDLEESWYDKDLLSTLSFGNTLYYLTGASDSALRQAVFLPIIGLTNVQGSFGFDSVKDAANYIYDMVLGGQWTIENMLNVVNTCYANYSGSSAHYKITAESRINYDQMISAGFSPVYEDSGVYRLRDSFSACANFEAWEALKPLFSGSTRALDTATDYYSGTKSNTVIRYIGNTVYMYATATRSSSYYAAILPNAKLNADQEYVMNPGMGFCHLYTIPVCNHGDTEAARYGFASGTDLAGYLMSAYMEASLGEHNSKHYDVRDAYLRQLAALAALHNDQFNGKPLEVLEMIFDHVQIDRGILLSGDLYDKFKNAGNTESKWDSMNTTYGSGLTTLQYNVSYTQDFLAME